MENGKALESMITQFFEQGDVISLHIVAEYTGVTRQFCEYVNLKWGSTCGAPLLENGTCRNQAFHEKDTAENKPAEIETEKEEE
jgi:hypothetical protein